MNEKKFDRIKGAVYGFAIGDAMGATTEFMNIKQIWEAHRKVTDIIGGGWLNITPGQVTDDTQMMMCVANALMKIEGVEKRIERNCFEMACSNEFVNWLASRPIDVGNQCFKSISRLSRHQPIPVEQDALGNGSLMRALPCALVGRHDLNDVQGRLTHNNNKCSTRVQFYSRMIENLVNGNYRFEKESLLEPTGCVVNTFNNVLYWFHKKSFEDAIIGAVNHGGDADTIAALTGGLAGARFGYSNIPKRWIDQLDSGVKKQLDEFIDFCARRNNLL